MSEQSPEVNEQINWSDFTSNEEIKDKLKELIHGMHLSATKYQSLTKGEVAQFIKEELKNKGINSTVAVSVSEPNAAGQRMVMGTINSPLDEESINF